MDKIISIAQLMELSKENGIEVAVALNGGVKSCKHIWFDEQSDHFEIVNHIDGSEQCLSKEELYTDSIIAEAIEKGALYID